MRIATAFAIALLLAASLSRAQTRGSAAPPPLPRTTTRPADSPAYGRSLRDRFGAPAAEKLLASDRESDRLRGVERLAALGDARAIERLVRGFEQGAPLARDPRARLVALRALTPYASREPVRQLLGRTLGGKIPPTPLAALLRYTAGLSLALSGDARSLEMLGAAVRQEGPAGEAAKRALLAYPPRSLVFLTGVKGPPLPAPICELFGELGDLRAIGPLRATLAASIADPTPASFRARAAAAIALARLGDEEQVQVARNWTLAEGWEQKLAGAQTLLLSGAREGARTLASLLGTPDATDGALRLALESPLPELLPELDAFARGAPRGWQSAALSLLGRVGGGRAAQTLAEMLEDPDRASDAAFALAQAPGDEARGALERALERPGSVRRLAVRAGVARALLRDDAPKGLVSSLEGLLSSANDADRATGAFGLVALRHRSARDLVGSRDPAVARASARAAFVGGGDGLAAVAERLADESDPVTCTALGIALSAEPALAGAISTHRLIDWAEQGGPLAPLAARALAVREGGEGEGAAQRGGPGEGAGSKQRVLRLLVSEDEVIRAHTAQGLGESREPDAVSRLAKAFAFEAETTVRRAIVQALSRRGEPQRTPVLELAAALDPDTEIREMARLALAGHRLGDARDGASRAKVGGYVAWIAVVPNDPALRQHVAFRSGRLLRPDGVSLPVVTDPDGFLLVAGLPPGASSFNLASEPGADDASHP